VFMKRENAFVGRNAMCRVIESVVATEFFTTVFANST
jgi:hypothetical protein